jgi:hypothetical protein
MRGGALLLCCLALAGCAPRMFIAESATLEGDSLKDASIRYEPMRDCWWKRMVPAHYVIERPDYRLEFVMGAGRDDDPPQIDVVVSGASGPSLEFSGLAEPPAGQKTDTGWSYQIRANELQGDLGLRVLARGDYLGQEQFTVRYYRCHGLGFGGT